MRSQGTSRVSSSALISLAVSERTLSTSWSYALSVRGSSLPEDEEKREAAGICNHSRRCAWNVLDGQNVVV